MKKAQKQIKLDDLANGKLPKHITDSIGKLKVTVEELSLWNNTCLLYTSIPGAGVSP